MKSWFLVLPFTCVTCYAGIVYQTQCEIINTVAPEYSQSVVGSPMTGGYGCHLFGEGSFAEGASWPPASVGAYAWGPLPSLSADAWASAGAETPEGERLTGDLAGGVARSSIEASDRIRIFGANVAAARFVIQFSIFNGLDYSGWVDDLSFRFNGTPLDIPLYSLELPFTLSTGSTIDLAAVLAVGASSRAPDIYSAETSVAITIPQFELLDANGQALSGYTWASESGWHYNFAGGQQSPEPSAALPIALFALPACLLVRRKRKHSAFRFFV
jgi:hypothetical protein